MPVRHTALCHEHLALGAVMEERAGWLLPMSYGDSASETATIRDHAGLSDIGDGGKIDVKGDDLDVGLTNVFPGLDRVGVGSSARDEASETHILRLTMDQVLLLTQPDKLQEVLDRVDRARAATRTCVHAVDLTGALCGVRLVGPQAPSVLERVSALDLTLAHFPNGGVMQGAVARIHGIILRRDAPGLPGYDLYVDRDLGAYLWDTMLEIGAHLRLRPVGRSAEEEIR
jgi:heterotetrameric sarcosine oxidase gamma subunit